MIILKQVPEINGAYGNQTWDENFQIPDGYVAVPDEFLPVWEQFKPFVIITIENEIIISMVDNPEAIEAQRLLDSQTILQPTEIEILQNKVNELQAVIDTMLTGGAAV